MFQVCSTGELSLGEHVAVIHEGESQAMTAVWESLQRRFASSFSCSQRHDHGSICIAKYLTWVQRTLPLKEEIQRYNGAQVNINQWHWGRGGTNPCPFLFKVQSSHSSDVLISVNTQKVPDTVSGNDVLEHSHSASFYSWPRARELSLHPVFYFCRAIICAGYFGLS